MSDVTRLLDAAAAGDAQAAADLLPAVYAELRQLAAARLAGEKAGHTLQPTALVHEAYLRLVGGDQMRETQIKAVRRRARRLGLEVIEKTAATAPTGAAVPAQE